MSILAYYRYLSKGKIKPVASEQVKALTNPSAMCTVDRIMVLNFTDAAFTLDQVKEITLFVKSLKEIQNDSEPKNNKHTQGV